MSMTGDKHMNGHASPPRRGGVPRAPLDRQLELAVLQARSRKSKAFLLLATGPAAGTVFPVMQKSLLIGRSLDADIWIDEQAVSHEHARLEQTDAGFKLEDLESTNGTYVNGQRLVGPVVLAGGDSIRMGSTNFTFVTREMECPKGTIRLDNPDLEPPVEPRRRRSREPLRPDMEAPQYTDSVSLTEVLRRVRTAWAFTKRYGRLAVAGVGLGVVLGMLHLWVHPPPSSAWFEMSVVSPERASDEENAEFSVGAESTFRSLPLIKKTLLALGARSVSDAAASDVQSALSFERLSYRSKVFRGEFRDASAERALAFLSRHLHVYIDSELDKVLKVLRSEANFDREQEQRASQRAAEARDRLIAFSEDHPEAVPRDAKLPDAEPLRLGPGASPERIKQSIASAERALRIAYNRIQSKKAQPYLESAGRADSKIAEAHARGLRDEHPEVKSLLKLKAAMSAKASALLAAEPSAAEQLLDPQIGTLKEELAELQSRLHELPARPAGEGENPLAAALVAGTPNSLDLVPVNAAPAEKSAEHEQSLAQLRIHYGELSREYERDKTEQEALTKKRESTDRQLERAQTSAQARFEIITPPTASQASSFSALVKRSSVGGMLGLSLAFLAAAALELRRVLILRGQL